MKRKGFLVTLTLLFVVFVLAACGGDNNDNNSTNNNDDSANASNDGNDNEEVTLQLAALESAYGSEVWENIIDDYEAMNENVTVDLQIEKNIEEVIRPKMQSGDYPDVFLLATDREEALTETMIKDNALENISDVLDMEVPGEDVKVGDKLIEGIADTSKTKPYGDDELYLAPMFYSPTGLFYNKNLLDEHDWDVPENWEEMFDLGEKADKEGISLFTYPKPGYFDTLIASMLYASGGQDLFDSTMNYEEGAWTSDEGTKVFDTIGKLKEYTHPNTVANAKPNDFIKNQQLVMDNEAIFMPNGTWVVDEMKEAPRADDFEWDMMSVPGFDDGDRYAYTFFEQIWIPSEAEHKDVAKDFIAYLYSDEASETFLEVGAVQPIDGVVEKLDEEKQTYYSVYEDEGALPAMGTFAFTDPVPGVNIADELYQKVNSVMSGKISVEEWQQAVEDASDKLRPALK